MSDTPRTNLNRLTVETLRTLKGTGTQIVLADFARRLERELATVTDNALALSQANAELRSQIRRLEEAGDAMLKAWLMPEDSMEYSDWVCLSSDAKSKWYAAKEAKP